MADEKQIRAAFPEIDEIEDDALQSRLLNVWSTAMEESLFDDVESIPWWPPLEADLPGDPVTTVEHVRGVTQLTAAFADALTAMYGDIINRDLAIAGALVHDISKLYEISPDGLTDLQDLVPHPHYGVHVLASHGCSRELQHIALSHSPNSAISARTLEARVVEYADVLVVDGMFWNRTGSLAST